MHDRNAKPGQVLLRANAGEHQQLRRVDGSAAQNDLARGTRGAEPAMLAKRHADRTAAFAPNLLGQGPGDDLEIGALHCRAEIADSGRAALSVACRRLVVAYPVLAGAVEPMGAARRVLGASEIWQHIVERPAGIAELAPMVEIFGLAADIDHAVDR